MNRLRFRAAIGVAFVSLLVPLATLDAAETIGGETWTSNVRIRTVATEMDRGRWSLEIKVLDRSGDNPILFRTLDTYIGRTKDLSAMGLDGREYRFTVALRATVLETKLEVRDGGEPVEFFEASYQNQKREKLVAADPRDAVKRVGGRVLAPELVRRTDPRYPDEARQYRVSGIVIIEATIEEDGRVTKTRVVKGLPFGLSEAAADAVMNWRFKPATMDGKPVRVVHNVTVEFNVHKAE